MDDAVLAEISPPSRERLEAHGRLRAERGCFPPRPFPRLVEDSDSNSDDDDGDDDDNELGTLSMSPS